jgi:hypothetical protein
MDASRGKYALAQIVFFEHLAHSHPRVRLIQIFMGTLSPRQVLFRVVKIR